MGKTEGVMAALEIENYHEDPFEALQKLRLVKKPMPMPGSGEVLVKVEATPCNPSDILFLQGRYGVKKTLPAIPGWEGSGIVVKAGPGLLGMWLKGKRVAFSVQRDSGGTWAQYSVVDVNHCIPLQKDVGFEEGASLIINPLTAIGLVEQALKGGHKALIQTAAASQVGRMVLALAQEKGLPSIHIVRRKEQMELLRKQGAQHVLYSDASDFHNALKEKAKQLSATIAFDAVAGPMTGHLLKSMPRKSKVVVYGGLSGENCSHISPLDLIFYEKSIEGFYLSSWLENKSLWGRFTTTRLVQKLIAQKTLHTDVHTRVSLEEASKALQAYQKEMTLGKVLIKPWNS